MTIPLNPVFELPYLLLHQSLYDFMVKFFMIYFTSELLHLLFPLPKMFFSLVSSLLQLSFSSKTQIMIFVLLKINRRLSVIISLDRHFFCNCSVGISSFLKFLFQTLSQHQSFLICHTFSGLPSEAFLIISQISFWFPWTFPCISGLFGILLQLYLGEIISILKE